MTGVYPRKARSNTPSKELFSIERRLAEDLVDLVAIGAKHRAFPHVRVLRASQPRRLPLEPPAGRSPHTPPRGALPAPPPPPRASPPPHPDRHSGCDHDDHEGSRGVLDADALLTLLRGRPFGDGRSAQEDPVGRGVE